MNTYLYETPIYVIIVFISFMYVIKMLKPVVMQKNMIYRYYISLKSI